MPKGQKFVDWTNTDNDKKLLHAIIAASDVQVNYEKVAKAFGGNVPAQSIQLRMNKLRKEAREKGLIPNSAGSGGSGNGGPVQRQRKQSTKKVANTMDTSDDSDGTVGIKSDPDGKAKSMNKNSNDGNRVISGRVTKPRKSPRASSIAKKSYDKMLDPYNDLHDVVDGDGGAIFDYQNLTPEDSYPSDQEYEAEKKLHASAENQSGFEAEV
ncbi:MAG: hypothetical protein Q9220_002953 [cf. Caloplaca sp. 1 TL-2023]